MGGWTPNCGFRFFNSLSSSRRGAKGLVVSVLLGQGAVACVSPGPWFSPLAVPPVPGYGQWVVPAALPGVLPTLAPFAADHSLLDRKSDLNYPGRGFRLLLGRPFGVGVARLTFLLPPTPLLGSAHPLSHPSITRSPSTSARDSTCVCGFCELALCILPLRDRTFLKHLVVPG